MKSLSKEILAFILAALAVVAGLAIFYYAGLDQQIAKARTA